MRRIDELHQEIPFFGARRRTKMLQREGFAARSPSCGHAHAPDGHRGDLPQETHEHPREGPQDLPLPSFPPRHRAAQSGLGGRHHLCADGPGVCLSGGDPGPLQPQGARLAGVQHTLATDFCVAALQEALTRHGVPEIFNTDQGAQFTDEDFTAPLLAKRVRVSMDGKGRWVDNVFVERLWRSVKYEDIYLHAYETLRELKAALSRYFGFYNTRRPASEPRVSNHGRGIFQHPADEDRGMIARQNGIS